ncbi:MAG: prepilin-type N-terminal cleavage/methylation domain-containing protein [Opitutus sp.]|nr:prepilin-type N-terminal cleavage/methylation domain-containing protein [Opitutus sp.]MCS6274335.1 prepilin-type N-terminal cleavage/methylation domain-containing protein [Opitutus sp.]MCS6278707.1 prepilin-type N-terminal cleavage/methylation domain-containing protein [Opitutus sp.]MCS6299714.1 prepilin-type N-terminal cleavage/methylation domain-containing protein [Opitutus sp.]
MKTHNAVRCRSSAFTLIELLVVIGLIGLLAGGLGVAMKNKNPGSGLRSAQSVLVSLLSSARGQSALNQVDAMMLVQADPARDNFLRSVRVVVQTASGATTWQEVGGEVVLPEGIYVVPPVTSVANATLSLLNNSDTKRRSLFVNTGTVTGGTSGLGILVPAGTYFQSLRLTSLGSVLDATSTTATNSGIKVTGGRLLVAAGRQTGPTAWELDNVSAIRGFVVSTYGVATLINDTATLDN